MGKIRVWTKQHKNVLEILNREGRYTAKREYIALDLEECADVVLEAYDWLVKNCPGGEFRPSDAQMPVWVSFQENATMMASEGAVILELEVEPEWLTPVNISKWGTILNYSYIPENMADKERHLALLEAMGISDYKAYTTPFYPEIRREILESWKRLFDREIILERDAKEYGLLWEIKREWIVEVKR